VKKLKKNTQDAPMCESVCESPSQIGENGPDSAPVCKCGSTVRKGERCDRGHLLRNNAAALIVGERSMQFWAQAAEAHREITSQTIADAGHTTDDAPATLTITARGLAQAVLIRDAAYERLHRLGGPLSSKDRARRAFTVWESAAASVERHVKLLGLKRRQRHVDPMVALRQAVERANQ
jgi:hypothetical protein